MTVVPPDRVPDDIVNNEAYMLFYQRRKSDSLDSTSNSCSNDHWLSRIALAPKSSKSSATISSTSIKESIDADEKSVNGANDSTHSLLNEEIRSQEPVPDENGISSNSVDANAVNGTEPPNENDFIDIEHTDEDDVTYVDSTPALVHVDSIDKQMDEVVVMENHVNGHDKCNGDDEKSFMPVTESMSADISEDDIDIEVELRNATEPKKADAALSVSFPVETWRFDYYNTFHSYTPLLNRGSLNFGEMLTKNLNCSRNYNLRHSLSTSLGQHSSDASTDQPSGAVCSMRSLIKQQQQQQKHQQHQQQPKVNTWELIRIDSNLRISK